MATINGTSNNDTLLGTADIDHIYALAGNDVVLGGSGDDFLFGDAGTDSVKGEAGNDVVKGGTGIGFLYGGEGDDSIFYGPTTSSIEAVGNYLSESIIHGESGTDTLNIFNNSTYGSGKGSYTWIGVDNAGNGNISFGDPNGYSIDVGDFHSIEKMAVTGNGLHFSGAWDQGGTEITGTSKNDTFNSFYASDKMIGGGGNDTFFFGGGNDIAVSATGDADKFFFQYYENEGISTVTGFNRGDQIHIDDVFVPNPESQIVESGGKTTFTLSGDYYGLEPDTQFVVDKVGLIEGVDYFLT